jgi:hypothetical protein
MPDARIQQRKLLTFVEGLRQQSLGEAAAIDAITGLCVTVEDGYCLYNLYGEWSGAFSYSPGRTEALRPILEIAQALVQFPSDDTLAMYELPQWSELVDLRGPVESVLVQRCNACSRQFPVMGTSGFSDVIDLVCPCCGSVLFQSIYDDSPARACHCGASYPGSTARGCPGCGSSAASTVRELSPYEYFASHPFSLA